MAIKTKQESDIKDQVEWFSGYLDLLVEDVRLEEAGYRTEIYFDTEDLVKVIKGMYAFYNHRDSHFDLKYFKHDDVLVHCLASAGWLGKIWLLPPHRAEFLSLMQRDFDLGGVTEKPRSLAAKFIDGVSDRIGIGPQISDQAMHADRLSGEALLEAIGEKADLAAELFKLLQCIRGTWRTRLMEWEEHGLLAEAADFDPLPFIEEEVFAVVREELDSIRGERLSMNNFSDALAVAILAARARGLSLGEKTIPLFFDHGGDLRKAIQRSKVTDVLKYRRVGVSEKEFPLLRDARYFFLRATFGHKGKDPHTKDYLTRLQRDIEEIRKTQEHLTEGTVRELGDLGKVIRYLREFGFFESIWFSSWKDHHKRVIDELRKADLLETKLQMALRELDSDELREGFERAREQVEQKLKESVRLYQRVRNVLAGIGGAIQKVRTWREEEGGSKFDMILTLGLFRFPFPTSVIDQIETALEDLSSKSSSTRTKAEKKIFVALYRSETLQHLSDEWLAFLLGILWAAERDREIINVAESQYALFADHQRPWRDLFSLVWAAALLREELEEKRYDTLRESSEINIENLRKAMDLSRRLEVAFAAEGKNAQLAVGIAYLNFRFFSILSSPRDQQLQVELKDGRRSAKDFLQAAMMYARSAWEGPGLDSRLKVYALNQVLYYTAEGVLRGDLAYLEVSVQLRELADKLLEYEGKVGWHYRYDDSLARYYECIGREEGRRDAWESGITHIERALSQCFGDPLIAGVDGYYERFKNHYEAWIRGLDSPQGNTNEVSGER